MLKNLRLNNYRNLSLVEELSERGNLMIAPNGSGKSNLLESIYLLGAGRSFRPMESVEEVIGPREEFAVVATKLNEGAAVELVISNVNNNLHRRHTLNGKRTSAGKIGDKVLCVLFAPHGVDLITRDPAMRRKDLDDFLSNLDPNYREQSQRYYKLLKNRNALLKHLRDFPHGDILELRYWTNELLSSAEYIVKTRLDFFQTINPLVQHVGGDIFHYRQPKLTVKYSSKHLVSTYNPNQAQETALYLEHLHEKLTTNQQKEINAGQTLYGPHKDDYELIFNGKNLRYLGSRGQQRLAAFTWKFAQVEYVHQQIDRYPIFLVDDLMSELDETHQLQVANFLEQKNKAQYILTSATQIVLPALNRIDLPAVENHQYT